MHLLDKSFIQPVIDWEAGLFGRLTATVSKNNATNVATNTFLMKFEKFVRFILYEIENNMQSYGSLHWWPFSRLCGLCHIDYDFIGEWKKSAIKTIFFFQSRSRLHYIFTDMRENQRDLARVFFLLPSLCYSRKYGLYSDLLTCFWQGRTCFGWIFL